MPVHRADLRLILAAVIVLSCAAPTAAQEVELGADFLVGFPQGAFKRNVDEIGFGFSAHGGYAPTEAPFLMGGRLTLLQYGEQSEQAVVQGPYSPVDADVKTTNNIFTLHLVFRMQPNTGRFRPYLEGFLGWNHLYTMTTIKGVATEDEISSEIRMSDNAFTWGAGGGIQFSITGSTLDDPEAPLDGISLHASVRYSFGGNARYLKEGSIVQDGNSVTFETLESTTNLLLISLGVVIHL